MKSEKELLLNALQDTLNDMESEMEYIRRCVNDALQDMEKAINEAYKLSQELADAEDE